MIKVLALEQFKDLKAGVIRQPNLVFDATPERFEKLKTNLGEGFVVEVRIIDENGEVEAVETGGIDDATVLNVSVDEDALAKHEVAETDEAVETYPKHAGGGYYELSNGEKVKGKDAAIEAEKAL